MHDEAAPLDEVKEQDRCVLSLAKKDQNAGFCRWRTLLES